MTFPLSSAFSQTKLPIGHGGPDVKVTPKRVVAREVVGTTAVHTSDIEQLEHDLRDLSFQAGSPEDARIFEEFANRVANFYKG